MKKYRNRVTGSTVDPECPEVNAFATTLNDAIFSATDKLAATRARREEFDRFERTHQRTCRRCEAYVLQGPDEQSPVWGGGTLGLLIGLVVGFFREHYWRTVIYSMAIGAILGAGTLVFSWFAERGDEE